MKITLLTATLLAALVPAGAALADDDRACGNAPRDQWMSEDALRARATELGYQVRGVDTDDGCYEVYAVDGNGVRSEIYFNPVSGEIVRSKGDD